MNTPNLVADIMEFDQQYQKLKEEYDIDGQTISPQHPFAIKLKDLLQNIENLWAAQDNRPPATVNVIFSFASLDWIQDLSGQTSKIKHNTSYDYNNHEYNIVYNSDTISFDILCSLRHEAEHARQSFSVGYTKQQHALIWLHRALPNKDIPDMYWNQYTEMCARIQEAKFCIESFQNSQNNPSFSIQKKKEYLAVSQGILYRLIPRVHCDVMKQFIEKATHQLLTLDNIEYLDKAFPKQKLNILCKVNAITLLNMQAMKIYMNVYDEIRALHPVLTTFVNELQQSIKDESQIEQQRMNFQALQMAIENSQLPHVTDIPYPPPDHTILLLNGYLASQLIDEAKQHYNAALCFQKSQWYLIYNDTPLTCDTQSTHTKTITQAIEPDVLSKSSDTDEFDDEIADDEER